MIASKLFLRVLSFMVWIAPMFTYRLVSHSLAKSVGRSVSSIRRGGRLSFSSLIVPSRQTLRYATTTESSVVGIPSTDFSTQNPTSPTSSSGAVQAKSPELELLEIRVGTILEVSKHPEADSLYIEKVDVGEPTGPRTIVSGLVNYCSIDSLLNRKVVVLCNLKPRPFKGIISHGMLLCASDPEKTKVEPLTPSPQCPNGELLQFAGHSLQPVEAGNKPTKAFAKIAEDFFVDPQTSFATFRNIPFMTSQGPISSSLKGKIS